MLHMLGTPRQILAVFSLALISIVMGRPLWHPPVVDKSEALAHSGRTLAVALGACHTVRQVGIVGSRLVGFGNLGHISLVVVC